MTIEMIYGAILSACPAIVSIIGIITALIKMNNAQKENFGEMKESFGHLEDEVKSSKQYDELKHQLLTAHQENRELRTKINQLLTKIDKIRRDDDAE